MHSNIKYQCFLGFSGVIFCVGGLGFEFVLDRFLVCEEAGDDEVSPNLRRFNFSLFFFNSSAFKPLKN